MADLGNFFDRSNEIFHLSSPIPKETIDEDCILGIDEAGRGPVLGPMVYAAAYYPARLQKNLKGDKFQGTQLCIVVLCLNCFGLNIFIYILDSKTLTEKERSDMFEKMKEYDIGWFATVLSPIVISNCMLKRY